ERNYLAKVSLVEQSSCLFFQIRASASTTRSQDDLRRTASTSQDELRKETDKNKDLDRLAELAASPFVVKILTITRSSIGHYELFGNRYYTLYDLVHHLSQDDSELPHRLVYDTLTKAVLPSLLKAPFQHVSRTLVDPNKKSHTRFMRKAGIGDKVKRAIVVNGPGIQKEVTSYMEKFDRPAKKKVKNKERETRDEEPNVIKKTINRMKTLGKGAFGAVYAGEFRTPNGTIVPVAVKSLRLVTTDKEQRLPWISEVEMSHVSTI
ncbi:unnamed protein product, partial [Nippostrongylus brasiliensis]|uniref:Protein kinase domain-containing protein n=1 Tax=Nippostrongylus brasiliensis TaxID=27835 RepID=A0A0N4YZ18_NIPBR